MFYAIPLDHKPSWRNPPWITLALVLLNMLVFWGPQRSEERAQHTATIYYLSSGLPAIELPAYVAWLKNTRHPEATQVGYLLDEPHWIPRLLDHMLHNADFVALLHKERIIGPAHPQYRVWKQEHAQFEALQPPPFTLRWSQDYTRSVLERPVTLLTSTFLHASTAHVLGNMVFLCLFGFSVELALGRAVYLALYLLAGIGASLVSTWAYSDSYGLGASGAISGLMGMYAVIYRLRRVRFFYQFFFYFNYVTAPALLLLPAWMANELLQHLWGGRGVAYMAHLGGLVTGAGLVAALQWRGRLPLPSLPTPSATPAAEPWAQHVAQAQALAQQMRFEEASTHWQAAALLRTEDLELLRAWFHTAQLAPASPGFHQAAQHIFALPTHDEPTLELQHQCYTRYLQHAKPGIRIAKQQMVQLVGRFSRIQQFADAEKLCTALLHNAPTQPQLAEALGLLVTSLQHAGQLERAQHWAAELLRLSPNDATARTLLAADKPAVR